MSKLIDADALIKDICDSINEMTEIGIGVDGEWLWAKLNDALENAPTIEPERKKGKWVGVQSYCKHLEEKTGERYAPFGVWNMIYCNQCWQASGIRSDFCPSCGADMRKGERHGCQNLNHVRFVGTIRFCVRMHQSGRLSALENGANVYLLHGFMKQKRRRSRHGTEG